MTAAVAAKAASSAEEKRAVSLGRPSHCEPYREIIEAKLAAQLSAQRIWQDLVAEQGFRGKYDSVKRFVRRLARRRPLPMRRMETAAGIEAQVDFGGGANIVFPNGKRRKSHVFRIVLSYSRKAYSEATFTQTMDDYGRIVAAALRRQNERNCGNSSGFLRDGESVRGEMKKGPQETLPPGRSTSSTRPRSGYSFSGCSAAEPESASPDTSNILPFTLFDKEFFHE